jgi:AraC-like DNA-binding protein
MFSDALAQHLLTAGVAMGFCFAMAVLVQPHNKVAHRWLALFLVCMGLVALAESLAIGARLDAALLRWQGFLAWSVAALAPALFMYIRQLLSATRWPRWLTALHFAPALLLGLPLVLISALHADAEWWRARAQLGAQTGQRTPGLISALLALQWASYGLWAWRLLHDYRRRLLAQYSNVDQRRMGWLGALMACLPVLLLLWLLARVGGSDVASVINTLYVPAGVLVLALFALRQPTVFLEQLDGVPVPGPKPSEFVAAPSIEVKDAAPAEVPLAGAQALLSPSPAPVTAPASSERPMAVDDDTQGVELQARLTELLRTERPYLDNDLSLATLAQLLHTSTHHLSQVLNQRLKQNFYELINELRVREVQRCLIDPAYAGQSILEIALDSGFSSKATFNAAFRRHADTTPSEFRRRGQAAHGH